MGTVKIDASGLRVLRDHAKRLGTLEAWSELVLEWAEAAEREITRVHVSTRVAEGSSENRPAEGGDGKS